MRLTGSVVGEIDNRTHRHVVRIRFGVFQAVVDTPGIYWYREKDCRFFRM